VVDRQIRLQYLVVEMTITRLEIHTRLNDFLDLALKLVFGVGELAGQSLDLLLLVHQPRAAACNFMLYEF